MKIINLTPHGINIMNENNEIIRTFEPSGTVARVSTTSVKVGEIDGIDLVQTEFGAVECLPDPQPDTVYIVSMVVGTALSGRRDDIIGPDTSPQSAVRDNEGRIIGVKRFQKY